MKNTKIHKKKGTETKEKIFKIGDQLILTHGYHGVGLSAILNECGIPKGSFYHYFKSKEDFANQLIQKRSKQHLELLQEHFSTPNRSQRQLLLDWLQCFADEFEIQTSIIPCVVTKLTGEIAAIEGLRKDLAKTIELWQEEYVKVIEMGQSEGSISQDIDPELTAQFILSSWMGALSQMSLARSTQPMQALKEAVKKVI